MTYERVSSQPPPYCPKEIETDRWAVRRASAHQPGQL